MATNPAKSTPPAAPPPAAAPAAETAKRTRTAFSKEKKIGYMLLSVLAILKTKTVTDILTDDQKAQVAKTAKAAEAIGAEDPFKAVNDRVAAIRKEMVELQAQKFDANDNAAMTAYVTKVKELSLELDRQIKRKAQITELLGK